MDNKASQALGYVVALFGLAMMMSFTVLSGARAVLPSLIGILLTFMGLIIIRFANRKH